MAYQKIAILIAKTLLGSKINRVNRLIKEDLVNVKYAIQRVKED